MAWGLCYWRPFQTEEAFMIIQLPVTYGSDAHSSYRPDHIAMEAYLRAAGFCDGDIAEIAEEDLW